MRIVRFAAALITAVFLLAGCDSCTGRVYVAGTVGTKAAYWVDGERVDLSPDYSAMVMDIDVQGTDVYTAGSITSGGELACYWKNGELSTIAAPNNSRAYAVCVKDGTIYTAGTTLNREYLYCWQDDATSMTVTGTNLYAEDICVSNGIVYIAGSYENSSSEHVACYWVNQARVDLVAGKAKTRATAVAVYEGDVYVSVRVVMPDNSERAEYWKNGMRVILYEGDLAMATDISVTDGNVYVSGSYLPSAGSTIGCYWKNGQRTDISDGSYSVITSGIGVADGDVYVAWQDTSTYPVAYWVSGTMVTLETGGYTWAIHVRAPLAANPI